MLSQVRHIFAGTAARTLAQAFIHPIDTIKTRLQASQKSFGLLPQHSNRVLIQLLGRITLWL